MLPDEVNILGHLAWKETISPPTRWRGKLTCILDPKQHSAISFNHLIFVADDSTADVALCVMTESKCANQASAINSDIILRRVTLDQRKFRVETDLANISLFRCCFDKSELCFGNEAEFLSRPYYSPLVTYLSNFEHGVFSENLFALCCDELRQLSSLASIPKNEMSHVQITHEISLSRIAELLSTISMLKL
jgi:hypothetical protein